MKSDCFWRKQNNKPSLMDLKSTYNKIAEDWHRDHQQDTWWIESTNKFISLLKPGDSVLDVGCGGGTKTKYLIGEGLRVTGIDFAENMIAIAKREVPTGTFFTMDVKEIPRLGKIYDGVFAQATLLHVPKREVEDVLWILRDALVGGGYLYVAVKELRPGQKEEEIRVENDYGYPYERFFSYFALSEVEKYLRDGGLEICYRNITPSGESRWIQVIAKKVNAAE